MNILENGDFIVLDGDKPYFVVKSVSYNGKIYDLIREITDDFLNNDDAVVNDEWAEEIVEGEDVSLVKIADQKLIKEIEANATVNPL